MSADIKQAIATLPKGTKIGFVGAGNMARSLIGGLCARGVDPGSIAASDPSAQCLEAARQLGVATLTSNSELVNRSNVVVLAVKPQVMKTVLQDASDAVQDGRPLLVSIAAGITCASLEKWSGAEKPAVVRCMPNTPALLQCGATGLYANEHVSGEQRALAEALLSAVGIAVWVDREEQLDAVTALSGSGPAYFFLLMEQMQKIGEQMGLPADVARALTVQTALGAARMAGEGTQDVATLRANVTSPNGTTHAAIETFLQNGFEELVNKALGAAQKRSVELAGELD